MMMVESVEQECQGLRREKSKMRSELMCLEDLVMLKEEMNRKQMMRKKQEEGNDRNEDLGGDAQGSDTNPAGNIGIEVNEPAGARPQPQPTPPVSAAPVTTIASPASSYASGSTRQNEITPTKRSVISPSPLRGTGLNLRKSSSSNRSPQVALPTPSTFPKAVPPLCQVTPPPIKVPKPTRDYFKGPETSEKPMTTTTTAEEQEDSAMSVVEPDITGVDCQEEEEQDQSQPQDNANGSIITEDQEGRGTDMSMDGEGNQEEQFMDQSQGSEVQITQQSLAGGEQSQRFTPSKDNFTFGAFGTENAGNNGNNNAAGNSSFSLFGTFPMGDGDQDKDDFSFSFGGPGGGVSTFGGFNF